jgi:hypothetical protein
VAAQERKRDEHDARAWLAWHFAALTRGTKGLPTLKSMLAKRTPEKQSLRVQRAQLELLSAWYQLPLREVSPRA